MKPLPHKLKGSGFMIQWLNSVRDAVQDRTPTNSPTVKVQERGNGFSLEAAKQKGGGGSQNQVCVWG